VIFCTFGDAMRVPGKTARCCRRKPRRRCPHRLFADGRPEAGAAKPAA
jgi:hypothetical protein